MFAIPINFTELSLSSPQIFRYAVLHYFFLAIIELLTLSALVVVSLVTYVLLTKHIRDISDFFRLMCGTQGLFDLGCVCVNAFWIFPMYYAQSEVTQSLLSHFITNTGAICWLGQVNSIFVIAINRYCAVKHPLRYKFMFNKTTLCYVVVYITISSLVFSIPHFIPSCGMRIYPNLYLTAHSVYKPCGLMAPLVAVAYGSLVCLLPSSVLLIRTYCLVKRAECSYTAVTYRSQRLCDRNRRMFAITAINFCIQLLMPPMFIILTPLLVMHRLSILVILSSNLTWLGIQSSHSIILLVMNANIRREVVAIFCKVDEPTAQSTSISRCGSPVDPGREI